MFNKITFQNRSKFGYYVRFPSFWFLEEKPHNSGEIKYQVLTTNPFSLTFLQRSECSCTHLHAIIFFVNPQKKYTFFKVKTP